TLFNLVGVLLILPFIKQYSRLIERLFPERKGDEQPLLDVSLLKYPELALGDVQKLLVAHFKRLAQQLAYMLKESPRPISLVETAQALEKTRQYLDQLHLDSTAGKEWEQLLASIYLLDHMQRLYERCQNTHVLMVLHNNDSSRSASVLLWQLVQSIIAGEPLDDVQAQLLVDQLGTQEQHLRDLTMQQIAQGELELDN